MFLQLSFGIGQRFFGLDALGNVSIGAEPAQDCAVLIADWISPGEEPAKLPILCAQGKGVLPKLTYVQMMTKLLDHAIDVFGMVHALPAPALHLFQSGSGVLEPALIVPENPTVLVGHPGQLCNIIGQSPESVGALARFLLCPLALGDVMDGADQTDTGPLRVEVRSDRYQPDFCSRGIGRCFLPTNSFSFPNGFPILTQNQRVGGCRKNFFDELADYLFASHPCGFEKARINRHKTKLLLCVDRQVENNI